MALQGLETGNTDEKKVVTMEEATTKRRPFAYWNVNGEEHKAKLTTGMIEKLENKYKTSVMNLITADGIPPLSVMLTVIQAAITPWEHGTTIERIEKMYDAWVENDGGNQMDLYTDVIMPICAVSGFFTATQAESIMASIKRAATDQLI